VIVKDYLWDPPDQIKIGLFNDLFGQVGFISGLSKIYNHLLNSLKFEQMIVKHPQLFLAEKWSLHSFLTTAPQQADVADNILLFFYKKKRKQNKNNNKILPATSACYETVVKNECRDHFSF